MMKWLSKKKVKTEYILGDGAAGVLNELLKKLRQRYPNRLPNNLIELDHLRVLQGQQDVLNFIQELIDADGVDAPFDDK